MPQPPDPNQNIEQQIDDLLNVFAQKSDYSLKIKDLSMFEKAVKTAKSAILALISKQVTEAKIEAVTELKRRWNDDRKTMDYSPATYDFICDKYLAELEQTPPTPNGDEQGGLAKSEEAQSE